MPRREQLEGAEVRLLEPGGPSKADLRIIDVGGGPMVVKDFAGKSRWVRWIGRLQIGRECRAYRRLGSVPGVARLIGRIDAHALALELIEGEVLAHSPRRFEKGPDYLEQLKKIVGDLHARGMAHLDLRGRGNVFVDPEDRIRLLDFASAVWFRPGSLAHRMFFRWFKLADDSAVLKWKQVLRAGEYTDEERAFLRRFRVLRSLWIFNRKASSRKSRD